MKTYGQVKYDSNSHHFLIACEPHVSLRLKRVFGKLSAGSHGVHKLWASDETARDLEWFLERYPMELSDDARADLRRLADAHRDTQSFIENFYQKRIDPLPFELAIPAREYQKEAAMMWRRVKGYLLADDVGLGKTVSSIAALTDPDMLPCLVVTLAHLPRQWQTEVNRFAPQLSTHIVTKATPYKLDDLFSFPDIVIMNYHKLTGWAETLAGLVRSVVFDECQELRRAESNKYTAAMHIALKAEYRIGLSATPIYNYGGEFYNVLNILAPGKMGASDEFYREWCGYGYGDKARIKEPKAFGQYLKDDGLMLRRTRHDVAREIPPVSKFIQEIDADTQALDQVSDHCAELARLILRTDRVEKGAKFFAAEELNNMLRQATGIGKAPYVAAFVKILLESGEKVVLYGWHRQVYEIWNDLLKDYNPVMYTGSESPLQKEKNKEKFVSGDGQVLIISLRAGAGLDGLQYVSKTVVFGELDWSPGAMEQCVGRVARDGQSDPVMVYYLVSETGSDPVVVDVLGVKKQQIEGVRNMESALFEKLQTDNNHVKRLAEAYLEQRSDAPKPDKLASIDTALMREVETI